MSPIVLCLEPEYVYDCLDELDDGDIFRVRTSGPLPVPLAQAVLTPRKLYVTFRDVHRVVKVRVADDWKCLLQKVRAIFDILEYPGKNVVLCDNKRV